MRIFEVDRLNICKKTASLYQTPRYQLFKLKMNRNELIISTLTTNRYLDTKKITLSNSTFIFFH